MRNSVLIFYAIAKISLAGLALCLLVSCGHGKHVAGVGADGDSHASDGGISTSVNGSTDSAKTADPDLLASLKDELIRQLEARLADSGECPVLGTPETVNDIVPKTGCCTDLKGDTGRCTDDILSLISEKFVSSAPVGDSGMVTDLAYDTDTHTLSWTYANLADYDGNGEVGVPDITPIANNFLANTTDGSGNDALESWIDGDKNGEVGVSDVTPIANNYLARIDGYRVYRKAPGEIEFSLLPDPDDAGSPLTIPHEDVFPAGSPDTLIPIQYAFADEVQGDTGIVSYYVTGYDTKDEEETEPSNMINIDLSTGQVNAAPIAKLAVDTDYGGAPLTVTFDASGSTDSDGTITEYRYDFDGDGVIDYSSDDAEPPAESSGGTVTEITPGASPWLVTATYMQCSAVYYYASVKAMDNDGALSLAGYSKIGVTGWVKEVVLSDTICTLPFQVLDLDFDPTNGRMVAVGKGAWIQPAGVRFAWRMSSGQWISELVVASDSDEWSYEEGKTYGGVWGCRIGWQPNGQPLVVISASEQQGFAYIDRILCIKRTTEGTWVFENEATDGSGNPVFPRYGSFGESVKESSNDFVLLYEDNQVFEGRYGLLWYENGTWSTEDTGYINTQSYFVENPTFDSNGILHLTARDYVEYPYNIFIYTREAPGVWGEEEILSDEYAEGANGLSVHDIMYTDTNRLQFTLYRWYDNGDGYILKLSFAEFVSGELREIPVYQNYETRTSQMYTDSTGISIFYGDRDMPDSAYKQILYHTRIENSIPTQEIIYAIPTSETKHYAGFDDTLTDESGNAYAVIGGSGGELGNVGQYFCRRLDPAKND